MKPSLMINSEIIKEHHGNGPADNICDKKIGSRRSISNVLSHILKINFHIKSHLLDLFNIWYYVFNFPNLW